MLRDVLSASRKESKQANHCTQKNQYGKFVVIKDLEVNEKNLLDTTPEMTSSPAYSLPQEAIPTDHTHPQAPWRSSGQETEGWKERKVGVPFLLPPCISALSRAVAASPSSALTWTYSPRF